MNAPCFSLDSSTPFLFIISLSSSFFPFSFFFFVCACDSASLESNIEEEEAIVPTASSQSKMVSCSKVVRHKTHLKCNGVVSH